jgi:hypothetical protein
MSEAMIVPSRGCNLSAIDIPSIAVKLSVIKKEILNASLLLPKIQEASISLEEIIRQSNFVEFASSGAVALRQSVHTLENNLEVAISEIREKMTSLEEVLSRKVIIPPTLSTADDISVAFHIAVNGPIIDWPFAEIVLERFVFLRTEEFAMSENMVVVSGIVDTVWISNDFESNIIKLLEGGDCWRMRKSLESLSKIVGNASDLSVSTEMFKSLVSILLQPIRSSAEDDMLEWVYLIAKNQTKAIDHGILRLINSGLYSRNEKTSIAYNVLKIISSFITEGEYGYRWNFDKFTLIPETFRALSKILIEEIDDEDVLKICFYIVYNDMETAGNAADLELDCYNFVEEGICGALVLIIDYYLPDVALIEDVMYVIHCIVGFEEHIQDFIDAGLLNALADIYNSTSRESDYFIQIIAKLFSYDDELQQYCHEELGMNFDA